MKKGFIGSQFKSRKFKGGAYATVISAVVIAAVILVNLIVSELGITADLTSEGLYSVLDTTKEYVSGIKDEINIYYLAEDGDVFDYYDLDRYIEEFNSIGGSVRIVQKDPIKNPTFAKEYTDEQISRYSFIVVNEANGRSKYIDTGSYITTEFDYNSYSYVVTGLTLEAEIVSALRYVTTDVLPKLYVMTGHGEAKVSDVLAAGIAGENIVTEDLALLTAEKVPDDCDILLLYQPQNDITEEEYALIRDYLEQGGDMVLLADLTTPSLTNVVRLLRYEGVVLTEGYVIEGDSSHYLMRTPSEIVPVAEDHDIMAGISDNRYILFPYSLGIMEADDIRSSVEISPILTTTSKSYAKHMLNISSLEKSADDYEGPFMLGAEITDNSAESPSRLIVYSCMYFLDDGLISGQTYGNGDVFYNTLDHLADLDTSVSVRPVSLVPEYVTVTAAEANFFAILYIILIPLVVIGIGIVVTLRRRKL